MMRRDGAVMIILTKMDKQVMFLNPDHIISVEETPDTVITLFNGNHYIVKERASTIVSRVVAFRAKVIRRSSVSKTKKYLKKSRIRLFHRITVEAGTICPTDTGERGSTPFHSRDI